jgi:nitrous oxide reductase
MSKATMNGRTEVDLGRRNFLSTVKYAAAISAAALMGKNAVSAAATSPVAAAPSVSGYHETGHIRKYYQSARY